MRTYYIYKATNLINGKSYIGKTNQIKERIWQHLRCYEKEKCLFHDAIEKYGVDNFEWEVLEETNSEEKAIELEKYYILKFNSYKPNGYNMNKGGVGGHNARAVVCLTLEGDFVKRYDSAAQAEIEDGFLNSDVLISCKDNHRTCKGHMFMFEDEFNKNGSKKYEKPKQKTTSIIQCDLNGNFIKRFESVQDAANKTKTCRTTISGNLTGNYKTANGFIFVYEKDFPIKDLEQYKHKKKGRKIAQVDVKTESIIEVFERISDAGKKLDVNYKTIHKVLDKPNKTAYGYKWISQ